MKNHNIETKVTCEVCGEGSLTTKSAFEEMTYSGVVEPVEYHYCECDVCGSHIAGSAEITFNNRKVTEFHKKVDGLLLGSEIKACRKKFDITQALAASLFGGGKVGFSRYENNDVTQSFAMDSLMRLCFENPYNIMLLAQIRNIELEKSQKKLIENSYYQCTYESAFYIQKMLESELSNKAPKESVLNTPANEQYYLDDDLEISENYTFKFEAAAPRKFVCN